MSDTNHTSKRRNLPELLAPAGSREALTAAIAAGADAVYLAGRRFGARRYAANFSDEDLLWAVNFAHLRNVNVYVTVNTLVHDDELPDVTRYLLHLYEIGADAVLVQDVGVAAIAREVVPDLPLHASTQMTIHNREGAAWAARAGFSRVVLARELGLAEIEDIARYAEAQRIGLEVFVHGALCYCYSGQCLLSSVIGGRSGNRGMCAQPCRKPYCLVVGETDAYGRPVDLRTVPLDEQYLLSTRDLAVYPSLDRIVQAPIASLKIEGRMRSPEYVAMVVDIYRRALDGIAAGTWSPSRDDMRDLALAFNREFTEGHILEAPEIMARERPGNRGILVGAVTDYAHRNGMATVHLSDSYRPGPGDGLLFCTNDPDQDVGTVVRGRPLVRQGSVQIAVPAPVPQGSRVFLTKSKAFEERARRIAERSVQPIDLETTVLWQDGVPVFSALLSGCRGEPLRVDYRADLQMAEARNRPLAPEQVAEQLGKTGGTTFRMRSLDIRYPGGLFAPLGELNRIRRAFLQEVEERLLASCRPPPDMIRAARVRTATAIDGMPQKAGVLRNNGPPSLSVYVDCLESVEAAVRGGARTIYLEPCGSLGSRGEDSRMMSMLQAAANACREGGAELVWKWPAVTRRAYLDGAVMMLTPLYEGGLRAVMVSGIGAGEAVLQAEPRIRLVGAAGLNIMNHRTIGCLSPNVRRFTVSPEVSAEDLSRLVSAARAVGETPELELIVQGNMEAMVTEDRLVQSVTGQTVNCGSSNRFWGLRDRRNRIFPIRCDGEARTYIANAIEICLIDHLPDIIRAGIDSIAIDARGRGSRYAGEMADLYRAGILASGQEDSNLLVALKEDVKLRTLGGITGGHFVRGLRTDSSP
jgi:putative protease